MMNGWNITSILGLGAVGLGFLLAFLTYNLLKRPQPNYTPIYVFEFFCFALVLIGAWLQYSASNSGTTIETLQNQVKSLQLELTSLKDGMSTTSAELQTTRSKLESALQRAESSEANLMKSYEVMVRIAKMVPASVADLQEVNRVLTGNYCSGGGNGQPLWNDYGPKTAARSTAVIGTLTGASNAIESIVPTKYLQAGK